MPLPTWRDVAAPDFSSSIKGVEMFSNLLNQGLNTASSGLKAFDQGKSDQVNKAIAMQLAALNDPATAAAQAQAIIAAADPNRISMENVNRGNTVTADLQNRAVAGLNFKKTTDDFARTERVKAAINGAQPEMAAFGQAVQSTDRAKIDAAHAALNTKLTELGMTAEDMFNFDPKLLDRQKSGFDMVVGYKNDQRGDTRWGWNVRDDGQQQTTYQEGRLADALAVRYGPSNYLTQDESRAAMKADMDSGELSPNVAALIQQKLGLNGYADFGGSAGGPGIGDVGGAGAAPNGPNVNPYDVVLGFGKFGNPLAPLSEMTMGQVVDFGRNVLIPNSKAAGIGKDSRGLLGSSASGAYQITQETLTRHAPTLFGPDWKNKKYDAAAQDKLGEVLFNDAKKRGVTGLTNTWEGLNAAEAQTMLNLPWSEAKKVIVANEIGTKASANMATSLLDRANALQTDVNVTAANIESTAGNSLPAKFAGAAQSDETPAEVAQRLAKANPAIDPVWMEGAIIGLMNEVRAEGKPRSNIKAAMAGVAIMDNAGAQAAREGLGRFIPDALSSNTIGSDYVFNKKAASTALKDYTSGKMDDTLQAVSGRQDAGQLITTGKQAIAVARARLEAKVSAAAARGITNPNLTAETAALQQAMAMVELGQKLIQAPGMQLPGQRDKQAGTTPAPAAIAAAVAQTAPPARAVVNRNSTGQVKLAEEALVRAQIAAEKARADAAARAAASERSRKAAAEAMKRTLGQPKFNLYQR